VGFLFVVAMAGGDIEKGVLPMLPLLLLLTQVPAPSDAPREEDGLYALRTSLAVDLPLTVGFLAFWQGTEAAKGALAPATCHWCGFLDDLDTAATAVRGGTAADRSRAALTSDLLAYALIPATVVGLDALATWRSGARAGDFWRSWGTDVLLLLESLVISQSVNQAVKFAAGRERPFVARLSPEEKLLTADPRDNNLSFYSGHTSAAFSLVSAATTLARLRGHRQWWLVAAVGFPLAALTGFMRMVADKHFLSDVLVGAFVSSMIGWAIPTLHGRAGPVAWRAAASPGGVGLAGSF
jgi:membrane-associated phospholipid phosphatase